MRLRIRWVKNQRPVLFNRAVAINAAVGVLLMILAPVIAGVIDVQAVLPVVMMAAAWLFLSLPVAFTLDQPLKRWGRNGFIAELSATEMSIDATLIGWIVAFWHQPITPPDDR